MTCLVTGTLRDVTGAALPLGEVVFSGNAAYGSGTSVIVPDHKVVAADANGAISVSLEPGNWVASFRAAGSSKWFTRAIAVPDAPTANLGTILDAAPVSLPVQALVDAQNVLAAMVQIVNVVVLNSSSELPGTPASNTIYLIRA